MNILVLSTQREHVYVNITGLSDSDILSLLCKVSVKRYYKLHGFYHDIAGEDLETIKKQKRYFENVDRFIKW